MTYVEPFVGGGGMFFRKNPSKKEIINDLDKEVYSVFTEVKKRDINNSIQRNLITEDYFDNVLLKSKDPVKIIEKYKRSFFGVGKNFNKYHKVIQTNFTPFHERLRSVKIYNKDFKAIIKQFDSPNTLFYLDPPYSVEKKSDNYYKNYVTPQEVYNAVSGIKGYFVLSYNNTKEIRDLFKEYNIKEVKTTYSVTQKIGRRVVTELVIRNFE
jgi:DNA adenine methylase